MQLKTTFLCFKEVWKHQVFAGQREVFSVMERTNYPRIMIPHNDMQQIDVAGIFLTVD